MLFHIGNIFIVVRRSVKNYLLPPPLLVPPPLLTPPVVPVFLGAGVPVFLGDGVPVFLGAGVPVFLTAGVPVVFGVVVVLFTVLPLGRTYSECGLRV